MSTTASDVSTYIKRHNLRGFIEIFVIIVIALIAAFLIRGFLIQLYYIPSPSMEPYLKVDDKIFVNKLAYKLHDIERGDVIVFEAPEAVRTDKIKDLVKRVVGLPGETVEGRCPSGQQECIVQIYVNGKLLEEPYLHEDNLKYGAFAPITIPSNSVLALGDNRDASEDGRRFGPIPTDTIVGRAYFRIWPLDRFGSLG